MKQTNLFDDEPLLRCTKCDTAKPICNFSQVRLTKRGKIIVSRRRTCKDCMRKRIRELRQTEDGRQALKESRERYLAKHPEQRCRPTKHSNLLRRYGMTTDQYEAMLESQGLACAICGVPPTGQRKLSVDHDHKTGYVRGLLCPGCNLGLGGMMDDPAILAAAIYYLQSHERADKTALPMVRKKMDPSRGRYKRARQQVRDENGYRPILPDLLVIEPPECCLAP